MFEFVFMANACMVCALVFMANVCMGSLSLSVFLSVRPSVRPSVCLPACVRARLPVCACLYLRLRLFLLACVPPCAYVLTCMGAWRYARWRLLAFVLAHVNAAATNRGRKRKVGRKFLDKVGSFADVLRG